MTPKLLRFAYVCEFLLALAAIFTAWPEVGSEAALELMHWGLKFAFGVLLSAAVVGYTASIVQADRVVNARSFTWLAAIALLVAGMGVVTYYYALQAASEESDEPAGNVTLFDPCAPSSAFNV